MIDTHCHIDLYPNPSDVAAECERLNIITIGVTNLPSHFELGYRHVLAYKNVRLALGMHPMRMDAAEKEWPIFLKNIDRTSYIGEIGLDFSREGFPTKDIQITIFEKILSSLNGKKKILSLHSRRAEKEVLQGLIRHDIGLAIFHWYSGPLPLINKIVSAGYLFSINPAMIKSQSGQEIIKRIPRTNILTESDGPFIEDEGKPITPLHLKVVYQYLAEQWQTSYSSAEEQVKANFKKMLSKLNSE